MASRLTEYKSLLWHLYIEKDLTAKQIAKYMEEEHRVKNNEGVYQRAFKTWDFKKNCNGNDYAWVDRKQRGREALGKKTQFTFNDQIVDDARIRKEISRNVSTIQQITAVNTPRTPRGWAAMTPAISTPGHEPRGSHTPHVESPAGQEANTGILSATDNSKHGFTIGTTLARQDDVDAQIRILAQTMRECDPFIDDIRNRENLNTNPSAMVSRYLGAAKVIVSAQARLSFAFNAGNESAYQILRLTFFNDYSQLYQFLKETKRIIDDVLRTALFLTCKGNQHQAANVLLSYGAEPNSKDTNGDPCIIVASRNNLEKMVKLLLDFGADVEAKDRAGKTSWSHVCGLQSHNLVASILQKANAKKNVNWKDGNNSLYGASAGGHADQVRVMLSRGMNPSFTTPYQWQLVFHWAASNGHPHIVKMLIEASADLNSISDPYSFGSTPDSDESDDSGCPSLPTSILSIRMQANSQVPDINAHSFDDSRDTATMGFTFSTRQNIAMHTAATSTPRAHIEGRFSSPYPYSRLVWPSESPTPFHSGQSPQSQRVPSSQTPMPASLPNTGLQTGPISHILEPI